MTIYRFGPYRLEKEPMLLWFRQTMLPLGPKVVETLLALVEHPGEILTKTELLSRVWPEGFVDEANLTQNIYVIRKTLRSHYPVEAIETVPRRGYRFTLPVTAEDQAASHLPEAAVHRPRRPAFALAAAAVLAAALIVGALEAANPHPARAGTALSAAGARFYAMGMYYWDQRTKNSVEKSIRYFEEVTRTDPQDARGYAGLAAGYAIDGDYEYGPLPKRAAFQRATQYARRALALNPNSAEALAALGITDVDADREGAGQMEFRRAIAADPQFGAAHQWYGMSLLRQGNESEAYDELLRAANLDPDSVAATYWLSEAAYLARRYRDAIDYARQTLDLSPQRYEAYNTMGMAYEALGDYSDALRSYRTFGRSCPECRGEAAALLAHAYAAMRDYSTAQSQLQTAQAALTTRTVDPEDVVTALIAMGRRSEALRMIQQHRHLMDPGALAIDPRMDPVRSDKRFKPYTTLSPG